MSIKLDIFQTMAIATCMFYLGRYLKGKISFLHKYCIPAPVIGGLIFSVFTLILKISNVATLTLDTTLQSIFMTAFFTTIGFTASLKILKKGGIKVGIFLGLAVLLVILQDTLGVTLAKIFKLDPLLGLATGSIPMVGGHGTAGSFGPLFESMGVHGATSVAFAAATFGLITGSFIGGVVAKNLIEKRGLQTPKVNEDKSIPLSDFHEDNKTLLCQNRIMNAISWIFIAMGIGSCVSLVIQKLGLTFPSYIGAMMSAAVIRNIFDLKKKKLQEKELEVLGNISLSFFLAMALMGLRLWELFDLAGPMVIMLIGQTVLMAIFAYFITFKVMGGDYEAAVFASGICGFGMGATPNAVANMDALTNKYGFAHTPYIVVPIVGCLFIDFVNSAIITVFINVFH